jgi:hypothetical protein
MSLSSSESAARAIGDARKYFPTLIFSDLDIFRLGGVAIQQYMSADQSVVTGKKENGVQIV